MLFASQLTSLVDLESPTTTATDGDAVDTWTVLARNVPAQVIPRESMTERQAAGVQAMTTHLVRMRIRSDLSSRCRLKLGTRYLAILAPPRRVPESRAVELVMECREVE